MWNRQPRRPRTAEYTPLARPLFIYVNNKSYADKAQVAEFVDFYIDNSPTSPRPREFIPLNDEQSADTESAARRAQGLTGDSRRTLRELCLHPCRPGTPGAGLQGRSR